ncbi:MAG: hypothetical protein R3E97_00875 [Candidatus Eisenbacteria bacterium]
MRFGTATLRSWIGSGTLLLGLSAVLTGSALAVEPRAGSHRLHTELELASVWQSRNDVQIPNEAPATRFSLVDLVGNGPVGAGRLTVRYDLSDRHQLGLLLAPLQLKETGTPASPVTFAGKTFPAGEELEATYRFNSWRLGYRYLWHSGARGQAWVGFTAKVRDAEIRIDQGDETANDTDVGFVPLLHLAGAYRFTERWTGLAEVEALGGGPGRAIDGALKVRYGRPDGPGVSFGYRTIEGGANVSAVYNFAWLHYAVVAVDLSVF